MINIKSLTFKNVLSSGNKINTFNFQNGTTTLIVGSNGSGKSQFYDALFYGLYGKPFRKIKNDQLINSINKKNLLVTIEFHNGKNDIKVIRGMKPNVFEIYIDGVKRDSESTIREQQVYFIQNLLKISEATFRQIIILGSSAYVPFMMLRANERTEIINDLLDLEIFSVMLKIARKYYNEHRQILNQTQSEVIKLKSNTQAKIEQINGLKTLISNESGEIEKDIKSIKNEIERLSKTLFELSSSIVDKNIENLLEQKENENNSSKRLIEIKTKLKSKETSHTKDIKFFKDNDKCPTCTQDIDSDWKQEKISDSESQLNDLETARKRIDELAIEIENKIKNIDRDIADIESLSTKAKKVSNEIDTKNESINHKNELLNSIRTGANSKALESLENELSMLETELSDSKKKGKQSVIDNKNYETIVELLKDSGLKSQIIQTYLPIINKLIAEYLEVLEFPVSFTFDNEFNEVIKARGRDNLAYGNFSAGEKMRIDLCLLFTWRKLASIKNAAQCNLLILDEIGDSSLDSAGLSGFNKILKTNKDRQCNIIISHNSDNLSGIDKVINVEKIGNFSTYREEI